MLQCIAKAIRVRGRKNSAIAAQIDRKPGTLTGWFSGKTYIPQRPRAALSEAIGAPIDWDAYEAEFAAVQGRAPTAAKPPAAHVSADPWGATMPQQPAAPRQEATKPFVAPTQPKANPAPSAPAPAPAAPRRGLLAGLVKDDPAGDWF